MGLYGHTQSDPAEDEHTEYEHAEYEHAEYEPSECDHAEYEHAEYEPSECDHAEYEHSESAEHKDYELSEYDHTEYEPTEYEHTEFHTDEFRMGPAVALIRNQVKGQTLRLVQLRAKTGEIFGVTRAKVIEKAARAGSTIEYGAFSFTHPFHPLRRRAAKDASQEQKKLATDRRRERVGNVKSNAAAKIAKAREGRIAILEEGAN